MELALFNTDGKLIGVVPAFDGPQPMFVMFVDTDNRIRVFRARGDGVQYGEIAPVAVHPVHNQSGVKS